MVIFFIGFQHFIFSCVLYCYIPKNYILCLFLSIEVLMIVSLFLLVVISIKSIIKFSHNVITNTVDHHVLATTVSSPVCTFGSEMVKEVLPFNLGSAKDWPFQKLLILIVAVVL